MNVRHSSNAIRANAAASKRAPSARMIFTRNRFFTPESGEIGSTVYDGTAESVASSVEGL
jgi:hypothetical protein